ncbi:hypothetical protein Q5H93_17675 [Hymenobacter sp. ASUV-10]|uniref:Cytochrome B n=1 Tax=Hymenobacter aranciens TaxID=3063996 RepID=A0ABT9BFW0_9BACT|nr:hypothetical protein [Hymenobacter sp. ASUV-10]MDO7876579.1 hypothetical protein [Hymenobacter sp. ASUV-10]
MYATILSLHSAVRWLVLLSLLYALWRAWRGYTSGAPFSPADNAVRHWTATLAHLQLLLGMALYLSSPVVRANFAVLRQSGFALDAAFFSVLHPLLMLGAIVVVTIGSALARRRATARAQFGTLLRWYGAALLLILLFIPWPFSPLAGRALFRAF